MIFFNRFVTLEELVEFIGAADTSVALAIGSVREILDWLDEHGSDEMTRPNSLKDFF